VLGQQVPLIQQLTQYNQLIEVLQRHSNNYNIKKFVHVPIFQLQVIFFSKLDDPINWLPIDGISGLVLLAALIFCCCLC